MDETRRQTLRRLGVALTALAVGGPVACGKRGDPIPPKGQPAPHPRTYPAPSKTKVLQE